MKILSLCGGGVRGLIQAKFLDCLQRDLDRPIREYFDVFTGTSIGGVLAAAFSHTSLSTEEILDLFCETNIHSIFDAKWFDNVFGIVQAVPKYDGVGKTKFLESVFGESRLRETDKHILIPAYNVTLMKLKIFKETDNFSLVDVLNATTAAPSYFPPALVDGFYYIDGGVVLNDPSLSAICEFSKFKKKCLTVSTGYDSMVHVHELTDEPQDMGLMNWFNFGLLDIIMDVSHTKFFCERMLCENFLNIDFPLQSKFELDKATSEILAVYRDIAQDIYNSRREEILEFLTMEMYV